MSKVRCSVIAILLSMPHGSLVDTHADRESLSATLEKWVEDERHGLKYSVPDIEIEDVGFEKF